MHGARFQLPWMWKVSTVSDYEELRKQAIEAFEPEVLAATAAFDPQLFFSLVMPDSFFKPFSKFHNSLIDLISFNQMTGRREVRVGPRGWGKSTTITEGGSLYIVCRNPYLPDEQRYKFLLIVSETTSQAEARLATIKMELETNAHIAKYFPHARGRGRIWRSDMIVTANNICIAAVGVTSSARGIKFENRRPDVLLFDDVDSIDSATSPTMSADIEERFVRDFLKLGHDKTDVFVVGTIVSKMCLCYKLLYDDKFAAWKGTLYKALEQFPTDMDMWEKYGRVLLDRRNPNNEKDAEAFYVANKEKMDVGAISAWPEVLSIYDLMREYYLDGRRSFMTEKQNQIIESDAAYFQPERYIYLSEDEIKNYLNYNPIIYAFIDPTGGEISSKAQFVRRGSDKFAITLIAKLTDDRFFLVDFYAGQLRQSQQFEIVGKMLAKWRITRLSAEQNAGQIHYITALRKYLGELYGDDTWRAHAKTAHLLFPRGIISRANKEQRISAVEPYLANGTIMLPDEMLEPRSDFKELMTEFEDWPNSEFDDGLDSFSGCFFTAFRSFRFGYLYNGGD